MGMIDRWHVHGGPVAISAPRRLKQLEIEYSQCRDPEAFFHQPMDDAMYGWFSESRWQQRR